MAPLALSRWRVFLLSSAWFPFVSSSSSSSSSYTTSFKSVSFEPILLQVSINESSLYKSDNALYLTCPHESDVTDSGPVLYDSSGQPVWMDTSEFSGYTCHDVNVQTYNGAQYLTVWRGIGNPAGYGQGTGLMIDSSYNIIQDVSAGNGLDADLHEFHIPSQTNSTALFTIYNPRQENLSAVGLGEDSWLLDSMFQEVDIASGNVLFSWSAYDHLNMNESYATPQTSTGIGTENSPWDAIHINSVDKDADGNYLISCRHFHQIFKLDKSSGDVLWRMGGMNNDFTMGNGTNFEWQHHARWIDNYQKITLFDNAATNWDSDEASARGLLLAVDQNNLTVTLERDFYPAWRNYSDSQGSMQLLDGGNYVIGYGSNPWITEHTSDGSIVFAASIGPLNSDNSNGNIQNYRVFKLTSWVGQPRHPPVMAIEDDTVFVSWNGATEVTTWRLYGGNDSSKFESFSALSSSSKSGFETQIVLDQTDLSNFVAVVALAENGTELGKTGVYQVGDGSVLSDGTSNYSSNALSLPFFLAWHSSLATSLITLIITCVTL